MRHFSFGTLVKMEFCSMSVFILAQCEPGWDPAASDLAQMCIDGQTDPAILYL